MATSHDRSIHAAPDHSAPPPRRRRYVVAIAAISLAAVFAVGARIVSRGERDEPSVTVFAASSLVPYFDAVEDQLAADVAPVAVHFAGSHYLVTQLLSGAPADLLISADRFQVDRLRADRRFSATAPVELFSNRLVLAMRTVGTPPANAPDALRRVVAGNLRLVRADPAVPLGRYTDRYLDDLVLTEDLTPGETVALERQVVSLEENARMVAAKLELGAADAAFIYASDAKSVARGASGETLAVFPALLPEPPTYYALILDKAGVGAEAVDVASWIASNARSADALRELGFTASPASGAAR